MTNDKKRLIINTVVFVLICILAVCSWSCLCWYCFSRDTDNQVDSVSEVMPLDVIDTDVTFTGSPISLLGYSWSSYDVSSGTYAYGVYSYTFSVKLYYGTITEHIPVTPPTFPPKYETVTSPALYIDYSSTIYIPNNLGTSSGDADYDHSADINVTQKTSTFTRSIKLSSIPMSESSETRGGFNGGSSVNSAFPLQTGYYITSSDISKIVGVTVGMTDIVPDTGVSFTGWKYFELSYFTSDGGVFAFYVASPFTTEQYPLRTYYFNDNFEDLDGYGQGYNDGYNNGYSSGEDIGYNQGFSSGRNIGYADGYNQGTATANEYTFLGLIGAVVDAPVTAFMSLLNFEIFGFNMLRLVTGLFTLAIIIMVVRLILGKG